MKVLTFIMKVNTFFMKVLTFFMKVLTRSAFFLIRIMRIQHWYSLLIFIDLY